MKIGSKLFIVKTLSGDTISIRNSKKFASVDVSKAEENGHECVVIEVTVDAIHTRGK